MNHVHLLTTYPHPQVAESALKQLFEAGFSTQQVGIVVTSIYGEETHESTTSTTDRELSIYAIFFEEIVRHWNKKNICHVAGIGNLVTTGVFETLLAPGDAFSVCLDSIGILADNKSDHILESLRRGDVLVCVSVPKSKEKMVSDILCKNGPVDLARRVQEWRMRGWRGFDGMSDPYSVEEIVRKKRQYVAPQAKNMADCVNRVVLRYPFAQKDEEN